MTRLTANLASAGWLIVCPAVAQSAVEAPVEVAASVSENNAVPELGQFGGPDRLVLSVHQEAEHFDSMVDEPAGQRPTGLVLDSQMPDRASQTRQPGEMTAMYWIGRANLGLRMREKPDILFPGFAGNLLDRSGVAGRSVDITASYRLSSRMNSTVFGYIGVPGEPAFGPPVSYMRRFAGVDAVDASMASHSMDATHGSPNVVTAGYVWRDVTVERSAFSERIADSRRPFMLDGARRDSTSTRLSFKPSTDWSLQLSRGHIGKLDQIEPNGQLRRTTVSATYHREFAQGAWQTTFAWGRNSRKMHEATVGYLVESTLKFGAAHAVFGRVEQVGSDELSRQNESLQRAMFKLNKLTLGYFHDVPIAGPIKYDVGAFASKHFIPSDMTGPYGKDRVALMMFLRMRVR